MSWKCPFWNFGNSFSSFTPFAIIFSSLFQRVISLSSSSLIVISLADRIFLFFIRNSIRLSFFFYQKMPSVTVINGHYLFSYSIIMIYFRFALTRSRSQTGNRQNLSLAFRSSIFRHQETKYQFIFASESIHACVYTFFACQQTAFNTRAQTLSPRISFNELRSAAVECHYRCSAGNSFSDKKQMANTAAAIKSTQRNEPINKC